ncbi:hypothetical protein RN001_011109 [Aquatica leii]|uniref:Hyaluronidase n=1 Tax=Aquatica leii TaxID=1421715 RepID=A0AAN7P8Q9_9COLE|nr:hypothetical protein RN001_011109 [Aquatica leii]
MVEKGFVLILTVFVVTADVRAQDSNDVARDKRLLFKTYWNMPTFQCARYKLGFEQLAQKYNILQNQNDDFRGDQISLLYDPGVFPAILSSRSGDFYRNGGVPQEGNLTLHLNTYAEKLDELIPNKNFSGVGVIDFESWRPIYRQNFGTLTPYKDLSMKIEKENHPLWTNTQLKAEAARRFEKSGRAFMEQTLALTKKLRPNAVWGYYAYPYCFNHKQTDCPPEVVPENDRIKWLFLASNNLHPSIYLYAKNSATQRMQSITGRMRESHRILKTLSDGKRRGVVPYFTLIYPDNNQFLSKDDINNSIALLKEFRVDGLIIWGSSKHVNTEAKCKDLYTYIDTVFGPALNR